MNWYPLEEHEDDPTDPLLRYNAPQEYTATGMSNRWLAVLIFIGIEVMLFVFFLAALIFMRAGGDPWSLPDNSWHSLLFPIINLVVLLTSAVLVYNAEQCIRQYRITTAERRLLWATGLGLVFLALQLREYAALFLEGIRFNTSLYGGVFYLTLVFHGAHVVTGIGWLLAVWYLTREARQTPDSHLGARAAVLYWGLVAIVWILLFLLLYVF